MISSTVAQAEKAPQPALAKVLPPSAQRIDADAIPPQLLNAVRLTTRVLPFLLEEASVAEQYLWQPAPAASAAPAADAKATDSAPAGAVQ